MFNDDETHVTAVAKPISGLYVRQTCHAVIFAPALARHIDRTLDPSNPIRSTEICRELGSIIMAKVTITVGGGFIRVTARDVDRGEAEQIGIPMEGVDEAVIRELLLMSLQRGLKHIGIQIVER